MGETNQDHNLGQSGTSGHGEKQAELKEIKLIELGSGFDLGGKIEGVSRMTLGFWPIQLDGIGAVH